MTKLSVTKHWHSRHLPNLLSSNIKLYITNTFHLFITMLLIVIIQIQLGIDLTAVINKCLLNHWHWEFSIKKKEKKDQNVQNITRDVPVFDAWVCLYHIENKANPVVLVSQMRNVTTKPPSAILRLCLVSVPGHTATYWPYKDLEKRKCKNLACEGDNEAYRIRGRKEKECVYVSLSRHCNASFETNTFTYYPPDDAWWITFVAGLFQKCPSKVAL